MRSNSCWAPPASDAFGRAGLANRRSLDAAGCSSTAAGAALSASLRFGARRAGRSVEDAACVGSASFSGSLSSSSADALRLRRRVALVDLAEVRVRVRVAVDVLEHDVAAEALVGADPDDAAVVDGDHRRALARVELDPAAAGRLDHHRRVALAHALAARAQLARVRGLGLQREAALGQAGERADEVRRQAADDLGAQQHRVDVPVGVVVGEDGLADVGVGAGGLQVAGGGEDRVDRVVRVADLVAVGVDPVRAPRRGHELHPPERARRAHVEVAAVVGLDLVDRGQDLPADAVLDAGGLVDREQERRDPELVDEEVRHADAGGARLGERVGRVGRVGRAVGIHAAGGVVDRVAHLVLRAPDAIADVALGAVDRALLGAGDERLLRVAVAAAGGAAAALVAAASALAAAALLVAGRRVRRGVDVGEVDVGRLDRRGGRDRGRDLDGAEVDDVLDRRGQAGDLHLLDGRAAGDVDRQRERLAGHEGHLHAMQRRGSGRDKYHRVQSGSDDREKQLAASHPRYGPPPATPARLRHPLKAGRRTL